MLEKMDSLLAQAIAMPVPAQRRASSRRSRERSVMTNCEFCGPARTQDDWGTQWDDKRREARAGLVTIIRERLPELRLPEADSGRLLAAARRAQERRDERKRVVRLKSFVDSVGRRFENATLENYELTLPEQRKAIEKLKAYAANIKAHVDSGEGIILFGNAGTGKTHCLIGLGKMGIDAGLSVEWVNAQELFARIRVQSTGANRRARSSAKWFLPIC